MNNLSSILFSFKGRVNRTVFWTFEIVWIIVFVILNALTHPAASADGTPGGGLSLITGLFVLLTFWPLLAVQVKRWHDRNKSGWWFFIGLVPLIGGFWVLIECGFLPGVDEGNRFNA
jgi:uncharacterized membrane protein YhaH (DUF805 family)